MSAGLSVSVRGRGKLDSREYEFPHPFARLGSSVDCDIRLPDLEASDLLLCAIGSQLVPVELNPTRSAKHAATVVQGRVLKVGSYVVRARWRSADGEVAELTEGVDEPKNSPTPDFGFSFLNASSRHHHDSVRPLRSRLTLIGRRAPSHLKLSDPKVADVQCGVMWCGERLALTKLSEQGVVQVNGRVVQTAALHTGDELAIGRFRMRLWARNDQLSGQVHETIDQLPAVMQSLFEEIPTELATIPFHSLHVPSGERDLSTLTDAVYRLASIQESILAESKMQTLLLRTLVSSTAATYRALVEREVERSRILAKEIRRLRKQLARDRAANPPAASSVPTLPVFPSYPFPPAPLSIPAPREARRPSDLQKHAAIEEKILKLEKERKSCLKRVVRFLMSSQD
jgi:hypothetical protein